MVNSKDKGKIRWGRKFRDPEDWMILWDIIWFFIKGVSKLFYEWVKITLTAVFLYFKTFVGLVLDNFFNGLSRTRLRFLAARLYPYTPSIGLAFKWIFSWIFPIFKAYSLLDRDKKPAGRRRAVYFLIFLWFLWDPLDIRIFSWFVGLIKFILSNIVEHMSSEHSIFGYIYDYFNSYVTDRSLTLYNSFTWWALSFTLIFPWLFFRMVWWYPFAFVQVDGSIIGRQHYQYGNLIQTTDWEIDYETYFEDLFHYAMFYIQNIMMVRFIFSYIEQVDLRANFLRYYHKYGPNKVRYGFWNQPLGREDAFAHWYDHLLFMRHSGWINGVYSNSDVVIFNKLWRNKAYLISDGYYYGSWAQIVKHNPLTSKPVLRKDPIFGQVEAYYTVLHQAEYWGWCYFPYLNADNLRFPILNYVWSKKVNDPQYFDWVNSQSCIRNWGWYERHGAKLPTNHVNNYFEFYYPQGFAESWGVPWLNGVDNHRLVDYDHPPLAKVVESHALYRAICFKNGWALDYTDFYPEYFLKSSLVDTESWFHTYSENQNPSLFNDVYMLSWMLCKPDYTPTPFTIRDLDLKYHRNLDLPRYSVSPASATHDITGDILALYSSFVA